jgi:hypothetical protein
MTLIHGFFKYTMRQRFSTLEGTATIAKLELAGAARAER